MQQIHVDFVKITASLAVIAGRAGGHHICPYVLSALVPGLYMVQGKVAVLSSAVLAGIIIPPENLPSGQFHFGAGPVYLLLQPDDRRAGQEFRNCVDVAASIHDHISPA